MMKVRVFTEKGITAFQEFLNDVTKNNQLDIPNLNSEPYSTELDYDVEIDEDKIFKNKADIGRYLTEVFHNSGLRREEILKKIIYERERIPLQELSPLLEFNDILELERWILYLPTKLFKIDDEIVIINKDEQDSNIVSAISMLLDKFQEYEELGLGKKI